MYSQNPVQPLLTTVYLTGSCLADKVLALAAYLLQNLYSLASGVVPLLSVVSFVGTTGC